MVDNKYFQRLSMSDIFNNLLSCSDEQCTSEKTIHVYDPKQLQNGWQTVRCNAKYVACPTGERRSEQTCPSVKNDLSTPKKRSKKDKGKETHENGCKYDKFKSLGVLSYGVPSWRTIIDPETCTYIQRSHPCYNYMGVKVGDFHGLSFVDPAAVLDQHLGSFVQRQKARNALHPSFHSINENTPVQSDVPSSDTDNTVNYYNPLPMPLNDLKPVVEQKAELWPNDIVTTRKPHSLKPLLQAKSLQGNLQASSVTLATKNFPGVLPNKCSTIDRKTGRLHREVLHSQKIKLSPFKQPFTPVHFQVVRPNRKQNQKLNWLPITTTSACLPRSTSVDQSEVRKPTWSKVIT